MLLTTLTAVSPESDARPLNESVYFRNCISTHELQVVNDAAADEAPADAVREGGDVPGARRGTFLDLALCLAGGLQDAGLSTLFKTAALGLPV